MNKIKVKDIVEKAGAEFVGIQTLVRPLVLFNHPLTKSTLSIRLEKVSIEAIRQKLGCTTGKCSMKQMV